MRDYMNRRVTPPKRVTSPTWGPPPPCKEALSPFNSIVMDIFLNEHLESVPCFFLTKMVLPEMNT